MRYLDNVSYLTAGIEGSYLSASGKGPPSTHRIPGTICQFNTANHHYVGPFASYIYYETALVTTLGGARGELVLQRRWI
jgi:hypothetical protein